MSICEKDPLKQRLKLFTFVTFVFLLTQPVRMTCLIGSVAWKLPTTSNKCQHAGQTRKTKATDGPDAGQLAQFVEEAFQSQHRLFI